MGGRNVLGGGGELKNFMGNFEHQRSQSKTHYFVDHFEFKFKNIFPF